MEQPLQFRSALNGFNREDVVRYLEYINNKHSAQVAQLTNELEFLRSKENASDAAKTAELEHQLTQVEAKNADMYSQITALERQNAEIQRENDHLSNRVEELEEKLKQAQEAPAPVAVAEKVSIPVPVQISVSEELEAYRRAERAERIAKERALQVGDQTASVLADASKKVDIASELICQISRQVAEQLEMAQAAVKSSRQAFQDAAEVIENLRTEMKE